MVASPTLVETGPEPLPMFEEAGTTDALLAEDGARAIGPIGASGSAAQPPVLTPGQPATSSLFGLFLRRVIKKRPKDTEIL